MKLPLFIIGVLYIGYNEFKRLVRSSLSSYSWFIVLVVISTYILFSEEYADMDIGQSIMTFKYGESPMADIIIFYSSSFITSVSDAPHSNVAFPASIGIAFFIILPFFVGLILIGKFIILKATASIAKEKEKKTLYIIAVSPQTRLSIFFGKLFGIILLTLPMIVFLYIITQWVFTSLFPFTSNLSILVLKNLSATVLLFASIGMLVSILCNQEKKAFWRGLRIVIAMAALTVLWIFIPLIRFILNLTNKSADFLPVLEKITFISPFTMDLVSVYNPAVAAGYFNFQIIASFIFLILGIAIFIKQDIEY